MPAIFSDVEVSAKVVVTDMRLFQEAVKELERVTEHDDYPALYEYLREMQHVRDKLVDMHIL